MFLASNSFDLNERSKYELSPSQLQKLITIAKSHNVEFFSTPFDLDSVKILNELRVKLFKIASADINNIPLINAIRKTKNLLLF